MCGCIIFAVKGPFNAVKGAVGPEQCCGNRRFGFFVHIRRNLKRCTAVFLNPVDNRQAVYQPVFLRDFCRRGVGGVISECGTAKGEHQNQGHQNSSHFPHICFLLKSKQNLFILQAFTALQQYIRTGNRDVNKKYKSGQKTPERTNRGTNPLLKYPGRISKILI